jgi:phenylacetate-CoA ligase
MDLRSGVEAVAFPAMVGGQAAELMALLRQFDASQHWPPERMQQAQEAQLRLLLAQAATVPFHARRLRDAGLHPAPARSAVFWRAWRRLPPLRRRDLQEQGARLHAPAVPAQHGAVNEVASGGSTGEPVRVRKTAMERQLWLAIQLREEEWHRDNIGGTIARLRGVPAGLPAAQTAQARAPEGLVLPDWGPPATLLWRTGKMGLMDSQLPLEQQVDFIARLGAEYIYTFPSSLRALLQHCRDHAIRFPALRSVWTLSEVVEPDLRTLCREVLGVRIVDNYSCAEAGYLALQCPAGDAYHSVAETVLVEVVRPDGTPCAPGETGRVLVTPLHNFAMPLLRYEVGDEAEAGPEGACACGRHLPVLARIHGRVLDHLVLPDGTRRRADVHHYDLSRIAKLREFQVVQHSREEIEMRLVVARPLDASEEAAVRAVLVKSFGEGFRYTLSVMDSIPRTRAGKLRPFVCEAS